MNKAAIVDLERQEAKRKLRQEKRQANAGPMPSLEKVLKANKRQPLTKRKRKSA